jgi:hypothetical protein
MSRPFIPGWHPDFHAQALDRAASMGARLYSVAPADDPIPEAISIPAFRVLEQGQAGTCHEHAATATAEDLGLSRGYDVFPICRRLVGWVGEQLLGGGNQADGGSPTCDLLAMTAAKGVGLAPESACPYSDDYRTLGTRPPQSAFDAARAAHVAGVAPIPYADGFLDQIRRVVAAGLPVANGIWWSYAWDNQQTFMESIGPGSYGHALEIKGYALPGVLRPGRYGYLQLRNWHGQLYPPLPPDLAAKVPGYKPDHPGSTSDFWVREDVYAQVCSYGNAEHVSAADEAGLASLFGLPDALGAVI